MSENIEYRCHANCIHNNYRGTGYSSCHLKNRGLKKNKDTITCMVHTKLSVNILMETRMV